MDTGAALVELLSDPSDAERVADEVDALFAGQQDRVYAICLRFVGDPERARDLAQDTMLVAWSKLDAFEGRAAFSTWLYSIARNLCFNAMRK
ncbi:MAG TPA: sigma-70 family RNA polymerase sigma factor [Myxococcota bacterium]|nr:sigma-70 family RNA polymerase sigma factor [Myxococcota bacterium]